MCREKERFIFYKRKLVPADPFTFNILTSHRNPFLYGAYGFGASRRLIPTLLRTRLYLFGVIRLPPVPRSGPLSPYTEQKQEKGGSYGHVVPGPRAPHLVETPGESCSLWNRNTARLTGVRPPTGLRTTRVSPPNPIYPVGRISDRPDQGRGTWGGTKTRNRTETLNLLTGPDFGRSVYPTPVSLFSPRTPSPRFVFKGFTSQSVVCNQP